MFHQLHCLNQIRQALHRDVYPETPLHGPVYTGLWFRRTPHELLTANSTRPLLGSTAPVDNVLGQYSCRPVKVLQGVRQ